MIPPGTIAFCTLASVIILVFLVMCYIGWRHNEILKGRIRNADQEIQAGGIAPNLELDQTGLGQHQAFQEQGAANGTLEMLPPLVWDEISAGRPGSGHEGLEVVPPSSLEKPDFASTENRRQEQLWQNGTGQTKPSDTNFILPQSLWPAASASNVVHSRVQASSQLPVAQQLQTFQQMRSRNMSPNLEQVSRTDLAGSLHTAHSSVEVVTPFSASPTPLGQGVDHDLQRTMPAPHIRPVGSGRSLGDQPSLPELDSPLHQATGGSDISQIDFSGLNSSVQVYQAYSSAPTPIAPDNIGQDQRGSKISSLARPTAPVHSHSSSLPAAAIQHGESSISGPARHPQEEHGKSSGRLNLTGLPTLPRSDRWSWNPHDESSFSSTLRFDGVKGTIPPKKREE